MSKVFVRWYNEVVEGTIVKEDDMFGMTLVEIPIQGVKVLTLFSPKHIYNSAQEACGDNQNVTYGASNKIVTTEKYEELKEQMSDKLTGYDELQKFLKDHWNHERNMLQLEYWEEYDRMFFAYHRKRHEMMRPYQPQHRMEIDHPATNEECFGKVIIPSTGNPKPNAFANHWLEVKSDEKIETTNEGSQSVKPRTIGKKVTVTELTLF